MNARRWHVVVRGGDKDLWTKTKAAGIGQTEVLAVPRENFKGESRVTVNVRGRDGAGRLVIEGSKVVSLS